MTELPEEDKLSLGAGWYAYHELKAEQTQFTVEEWKARKMWRLLSKTRPEPDPIFETIMTRMGRR